MAEWCGPPTGGNHILRQANVQSEDYYREAQKHLRLLTLRRMHIGIMKNFNPLAQRQVSLWLLRVWRRETANKRPRHGLNAGARAPTPAGRCTGRRAVAGPSSGFWCASTVRNLDVVGVSMPFFMPYGR